MFINTGFLEAKPSHAAQVLTILTTPNPELAAAGCLSYEVGVDADNPDLIRIVEIWESAEHHQQSLQLPSVRQAIGQAMPLLTSNLGGHRFDSLGSPLRTD